MQPRIRSLLLIALGWLLLPAARADEPPPEPAQPVRYLQSWLGAVSTGKPWLLPGDETGGPFERSVGTLPYIGGSGMVLNGEGVRYGFEGGGLVTWKNYGSSFGAVSSDGLVVAVAVDNQLFSFETFLGGVLAFEPRPGVRLVLAGGPALAWMRLSNDDEEVEVTPVDASDGSSAFIRLNSSESDVSFTFYGRVGLELQTRSGLMVGVSARYAEHDFDFGSSGELRFDRVQWFLTLGAER